MGQPLALSELNMVKDSHKRRILWAAGVDAKPDPGSYTPLTLPTT